MPNKYHFIYQQSRWFMGGRNSQIQNCLLLSWILYSLVTRDREKARVSSFLLPNTGAWINVVPNSVPGHQIRPQEIWAAALYLLCIPVFTVTGACPAYNHWIEYMEGACWNIHDPDFTDQIATQPQTGSASDWIWCFLKTRSHLLLPESTECQRCGLKFGLCFQRHFLPGF